MVIKKINEKSVWDNFIDSNSTSQLFHKWDFLNIISQNSGYKLFTYGIYNKEELICIFPLFYKKILFFKMLFSPPPLTGIPYLGFIIYDKYYNLKQSKKEEFLKIILDDVTKCIDIFKPDYSLISLIPEINDVRYFKSTEYIIDINYTYKLELDNLANIWNNFTKDLRKKINNAEILNINIQEEYNTDAIYDMLSKRYSEKGLKNPILSMSYLNDIKKTFPDNIVINIAKYDDKIIGSEIIIRYKKNHLDWIGGTKPSIKIPLNEYLIWNSIKKSFDKQLMWFDFAGANTKGISFFKSQFNPKLIQSFVLIKENIIGQIAKFLYYSIIKKIN